MAAAPPLAYVLLRFALGRSTTTEDREVGADVLAQPVDVDVVRQSGVGVAGLDQPVQLTEIGGTPHPEHTGTTVEHGLDLGRRHAGFPG